jgi:hypothetical protein
MPELKIFVYRPYATAPNRKVVVPLKGVRRVTVAPEPKGASAEMRGPLVEIETTEERIVVAIE